MSISVSIVEDDHAYRESLVALLKGSPGFTCVGAHSNGKSALQNIRREKPDVVLMDIRLPETSGIEYVGQIKACLPKTKVLMLTMSQDTKEIFEALEAGAHGYLVKDAPFAQILDAIQEVHEGGAPMSAMVAQKVIQFFHQRGRTSKDLEDLTTRETEVLSYLAQGWRDKEIAEKLGCASRTIAAHCHNIYEKLHVQSRAGAVSKFLRKESS